MERAAPAFDEALALLLAPSGASGAREILMPDRLQLTRALAAAFSQAPLDNALAGVGRLSEQLPIITDKYNTNSHFCLSVVAFMESLVLGYANEDLALGELGRQWLDEDELLVRRRIHRDLRST
jgi:hypothetical protein